MEFHHGIREVERIFGAGDGDVEDAAFLFLAPRIAQRLRRGETPFRQPHEKDHLPLESLRLMHGAEDHAFLIGGRGAAHFLAVEFAEEDQLGQESVRACVGRRKLGQALDFFEARCSVVVVGAEVLGVGRRQDRLDELGRWRRIAQPVQALEVLSKSSPAGVRRGWYEGR